MKVSSVSRALTWIVCACTLPASVAALAAVLYHYDFARDELFASSVRRAASISLSVETTVRGAEIALRTLASSAHLNSDDLRRFHEQAQDVLPILDSVNNIYLTDPAGRLLMNTQKRFGSSMPALNNPGLILRAAATGRTQVSKVFTGSVTKRPLIAIAVPVMRDDKLVMVLAATILAERITQLLNQQHAPSDWIISVHDQTGRFIARSHEQARFVGRPPSPDLKRAMQGRPEGTLMGTTSEGIPVFAAYTRSAYSGWTVAVGIPRHSLLRRLNLSIVSVCMLVIVSVGVGLGVAALTARRIRGAIIAMIPAAEALSLAKTVELPEDRYEETRLLGEALKNASEKLRRSEHAAHHDLLTGLPNRAFLQAVLPAMASQAMRLQHPLTLLYLDLDGFKQVNDKLGHAAGDEVLSQTAWRIRACIRAADIGIRLGGDEFVVMLPNTGRAGALETAERIRLSVEQRMELQWGEARVSASIGLACFPEDCATVDELFYLADKAMYGAKRDGKNTVHSAVHSAAHSAAHSAEAVTRA